MKDLALQVGLVDHIHVDDAERAHAGGGQVKRGRRAQTAGPEEKHLGVEQPELAFLAHLGQQEVARVPVALVRRQHVGRFPVATLVLPAVEPAVHRHDVGVAQVLERLGREGRSDPTGAEHQQGRVPWGDPGLDLALQMASGDVHRVGDGALFVLVGLAHVEHHGAGRGPGRVGLGGGHLADLGLGRSEQLAEIGHA